MEIERERDKEIILGYYARVTYYPIHSKDYEKDRERNREKEDKEKEGERERERHKVNHLISRYLRNANLKIPRWRKRRGLI